MKIQTGREWYGILTTRGQKEEHFCHGCHNLFPIDSIIVVDISSITLLCTTCLTTLHSITNPLSVLVTTGLDTSQS